MEQLETISIENLDFSTISLEVTFNNNHFLNIASKATYILTLAIVLLLLHAFKKRSIHKVSTMNTIPWITPSLPWIGPLHFLQNRDDLAKLQEYWASKYPKFARTTILGRDYVLLNSPVMIQKLFNSTDLGHLVKPEEMYSKLFMDVVGKGLLIANPEIWQPHRKQLNKSFNYESLKSYVNIFKKHGDKLAHELESRKDVTVGHSIHDACLEIITEIVMGISLDDTTLRSDFLQELHHRMSQYFVSESNRFNAIITKLQKEPWLLVDFVWNLHPCKRDLQNTVQCIIDSCDKVLKQRMGSTVNVNESKCIMDAMIEENWSDVEILSESINLIVGGHETVSGALKFLLFLLANEKEHQVICQKEVDTLFDKLESTDEELSIQSVSELKYLERCIKEALRMYPPGCMNWRELKSPLKLDDDVTIDPGTIVGVLVWGVHRNPNYFPNPNKFDPDRFLPANIKIRLPNSFLSFSSGPRNCIGNGWKMAMLEMPIIASAILRHFDISTTDKIEDIKLNFSFMLTPQKEPNIILTRRKNVAA